MKFIRFFLLCGIFFTALSPLYAVKTPFDDALSADDLSSDYSEEVDSFTSEEIACPEEVLSECCGLSDRDKRRASLVSYEEFSDKTCGQIRAFAQSLINFRREFTKLRVSDSGFTEDGMSLLLDKYVVFRMAYDACLTKAYDLRLGRICISSDVLSVWQKYPLDLKPPYYLLCHDYQIYFCFSCDREFLGDKKGCASCMKLVALHNEAERCNKELDEIINVMERNAERVRAMKTFIFGIAPIKFR